MVSWPKWNRSSDARDGGVRDNGPTEASVHTSAPAPAAPARPKVHLTPAALEQLQAVLESRGGLHRVAVRVLVDNPGAPTPNYNMALEEGTEPKPGDTVVDIQGIRVLVDAASLPSVDGATVDFVADPLRPGFKVEAPRPPQFVPLVANRPKLDLADPLVRAVQDVLDSQVNPGIASHGGRASLVDVKGGVAYVELGGGCQGCSMASVTLKQGVERMIRTAVPQIEQVVDTTDHAGGTNPYFQQAKGGESPFATSAKG